MQKKAFLLFVLLAVLAVVAYAQGANSGSVLKFIEWRLGDVIRILLCAIWFITAGILGLIALLSGIKYLTGSPDERHKARKMVIYSVFGFIIVVVACPTVNYLVDGSDVRQFNCVCIREVPPTSTTSTTTSTWVYYTVTTVTTSTTTTIVISTSTTTWPKSNGGRFLLVGENLFQGGTYAAGDLYGVIFNYDGSIHKNAFKIDSGIFDPVALGVGNNRFFIAYGASATVLDWEGQTIKSKFTTGTSEFPVKVIQNADKFYLLLSPKGSGGCEIKVYDINGNPLNTFKVDIDSISYMDGPFWASNIFFPEGDMSLGAGNLFIVWSDAKTSMVYGMMYDLNGKKVKDKFSITAMATVTPPGPFQNPTYENSEVETGSKYFMVAYDDKTFLYDFSANLVSQKQSGLQHVHDLAYGDGKFLAVEDSNGKFYDEDGNSAGNGAFGGHGDVPTTLSYGNHMFVGIVAIHMGSGDGIGVSFVDSKGVHIIDTMPLVMAESPGWSAYDW